MYLLGIYSVPCTVQYRGKCWQYGGDLDVVSVPEILSQRSNCIRLLKVTVEVPTR